MKNEKGVTPSRDVRIKYLCNISCNIIGKMLLIQRRI